MAPQTAAERIINIKTVTDFVSLMVNVVNNSKACAAIDQMKTNGSTHIFCGLETYVILIFNGDFTTWVNKTGRGSHLHWILF